MHELLCFNQKWNILDIIYNNNNTIIYKVSRPNNSFYNELSIIVITLNNINKKELKALTKLYEKEIEKMISLKSSSNIISIDDYEIKKNKKNKQLKIYIRCNYIESINKLESIESKDIFDIAIAICNTIINANKIGINNISIKYENIFITKFNDYEISTINIEQDDKDNIKEIGEILYQFFNGGKILNNINEKPIYSTTEEYFLIKELLNKRISIIEECKKNLILLKNNSNNRIIPLDNKEVLNNDKELIDYDSTMSVFDINSKKEKDGTYYDMTQSVFDNVNNKIKNDDYYDKTMSIFDSNKE